MEGERRNFSKIIFRNLWVLLVLTGFCACEETKNELPIEYTGPLVETDSVEMYYSDSGVTVLHMKAPKQLKLRNEDQEFPKGIFIQFFEKEDLRNTIVSDYAYYEEKGKLWKISGNAQLADLKKGDTLFTEVLYWKPETHEIYSEEDQMVKIVTTEQILTGRGLKAKDDFSDYEILEPIGTFIINDQK